MGRRNTGWNPEVVKRFNKEGRGKGDGVNYKPWLTTHDVASKGCCVRAFGRTVPRIYHLLSHLEMNFFYQLDHTPGVTDIKEQYPLDLNLTQMLAFNADIKHPQINGYPAVMTTDFYYCENGEWKAAAVKPSSELVRERVSEKLKIERLYWEKHGIQWRIVTEENLNRTLTMNLIWLYTGENFEVLVPSEKLRECLQKAFLELYSDMSVPFTAIVEVIEKECELRMGTVLQLFKKLIISNQIQIDLTKTINTFEPRTVTGV